MRPIRHLGHVLRDLLIDAERPTLFRLFASAGLVMLGAAISALAPLALKALIDSLAGAASASRPTAVLTPTAWGALYLLALCGTRLLTDLRPALAGVAEQRLYAALRRRFCRHLLALPMSFHLERASGHIGQCLPQAISGYQVILFHLINSIVPVSVEMVTVIVVLITLNESALTANFLVCATAMLAVMQQGTPRLSYAAHAVSKASTEVQGHLTDTLLNVEPIKSFSAQAFVLDQFALNVDRLEKSWATLQRHRRRMALGVSVTITLAMTSSLAIAVHLVSKGQLTIGGFVMANLYMLQIVRPLELLGSASREITQALAFIHPLQEVFAEPIETEVHAEPVPNDRELNPGLDRTPETSGSPMLSVRGVTFAYAAGPPVLRDVSIDIESGRVIGVVGASGSGKSSLVRLLLRLHVPQRGTIRLRGTDIAQLTSDDLRAQIAVVPQDTILLNDTLANNIGLGKPGSTQRQIECAAKAAHLHDFVVGLANGYDTVVGERGLKLSGGERQRIAIARAVLRNAPVIVLDEATSMLDSITEAAILQNLKEITIGRTTVIVAHRLSTVRHADQIVVLDDGRIVERGTHADLLARGSAYAAMWHAQSQRTST